MTDFKVVHLMKQSTPWTGFLRVHFTYKHNNNLRLLLWDWVPRGPAPGNFGVFFSF